MNRVEQAMIRDRVLHCLADADNPVTLLDIQNKLRDNGLAIGIDVITQALGDLRAAHLIRQFLVRTRNAKQVCYAVVTDR